jgi:HPt (histidine-containing phosphotransfer) domain-containing protein
MDNTEELYMKLKSFNVKEGLSRVGGNPELYTRILKSYEKTFKDAVQRIKKLQQAGKTTDLLRDLHTLKGTAANLASTEVHRLAAALEQRIKEGREIVNTGEFEALHTALITCFQEINRLSGTDGKEIPGILPAAILKQKLSALKDRLADYDVDAVDLLGEIRDSLCEMGYEREVMKLEEKTSIYDFDGALEAFTGMENDMKRPI